MDEKQLFSRLTKLNRSTRSKGCWVVQITEITPFAKELSGKKTLQAEKEKGRSYLSCGPSSMS